MRYRANTSCNIALEPQHKSCILALNAPAFENPGQSCAIASKTHVTSCNPPSSSTMNFKRCTIDSHNSDTNMYNTQQGSELDWVSLYTTIRLAWMAWASSIPHAPTTWAIKRVTFHAIIFPAFAITTGLQLAWDTLATVLVVLIPTFAPRLERAYRTAAILGIAGSFAYLELVLLLTRSRDKTAILGIAGSFAYLELVLLLTRSRDKTEERRRGDVGRRRPH